MILEGADVYSMLNTIMMEARYFQQPTLAKLIIECFDWSCVLEILIWFDFDEIYRCLMAGDGEPEKTVPATEVLGEGLSSLMLIVLCDALLSGTIRNVKYFTLDEVRA